MNELISQILCSAAGLALAVDFSYTRKFHCFLFFGEPDFSEMDADLLED